VSATEFLIAGSRSVAFNISGHDTYFIPNKFNVSDSVALSVTLNASDSVTGSSLKFAPGAMRIDFHAAVIFQSKLHSSLRRGTIASKI
jgi:hypothetical protein